jgi:hypothetical protein
MQLWDLDTIQGETRCSSEFRNAKIKPSVERGGISPGEPLLLGGRLEIPNKGP